MYLIDWPMVLRRATIIFVLGGVACLVAVMVGG